MTVSNDVWFPTSERAFDSIDQTVLEYGKELDADHPGFHDTAYRERRRLITENALRFKTGQPIPHVQYSAEENATWAACFSKLTELYPTHACAEYNACFALMNFKQDEIPQLEDVSNTLQKLTGWRIRPVAGLLSPRQFLNSLAFKIFHATQYIRHPSRPLYTAEPDVVHELLGHCPMLADPTFARFSQLIGLASLGATEDEIERLATCYWFSVEFGICKDETGALKAYGAGLLSSFGELQYSLGTDKSSGSPEYRPFDPPVTASQKYPITCYQPIYFVADSFSRSCEQMLQFSKTLSRPYDVEYDDKNDAIVKVERQ
jgi:phenylalanine-4-hydroxylase